MKKLLIKIATCIVGFICVLVIYFLSIYEKRTTSTEIMQSATLPIVNMVYQDTSINVLQGYTT